MSTRTGAAHGEDPLVALPPHLQELFAARLERWLPDLDAALVPLYDDAGAVRDRLVALAARAFAERSDALRALDLRRTLAPDWFQRPEVIGYAAYAEHLGGTLAGVADRASYLHDLGVRLLHLLGPGPATREDLRVLTARLRQSGISLCLDLVLNHVDREHEWAVRARAGEQRFRDRFWIYPDRTEPDAIERALPQGPSDPVPDRFTWDDELGGWVWTTFHRDRWDVNWSNPAVICSYAEAVLELANDGVEVFQLDAIAFTWKRPGTDCRNQPEVHALTQALRTIVRIACPATLFAADVVAPQDMLDYLGRGQHWGKVSDLAHHDALMVHLWSMLASRGVRLASAALRSLPTAPATTAWITYARSHDAISWTIDDETAAAVGATGQGHRSFLSDFYAGDFPGSWARGLVVDDDPATGERTIDGSLATLAGLEAGDPSASDRIRLAHALVLGFGGVPMIRMGDELGLLGDPETMPWPVPPDEHGIGRDLRALIAARAALPHLHASVPADVLQPRDPGVLLVARRHPIGAMLGVYNATADRREVPREVFYSLGLDPHTAIERITGARLRVRGETVEVAPYDAMWITAP